jgi:hypothetical protein
MTAVAHPHALLLQQVQQEFADIFTQTGQGVYIYLDDAHWISNHRLVTLLGYASAEELVEVATSSSFLEAVVAADSQQPVVDAYRNAVDTKNGSTISVTLKKKGGAMIKTQIIFVPISFRGTILALHFITPM